MNRLHAIPVFTAWPRSMMPPHHKAPWFGTAGLLALLDSLQIGFGRDEAERIPAAPRRHLLEHFTRLGRVAGDEVVVAYSVALRGNGGVVGLAVYLSVSIRPAMVRLAGAWLCALIVPCMYQYSIHSNSNLVLVLTC